MVNQKSPETIKQELRQLVDKFLLIQNQKSWDELVTEDLQKKYEDVLFQLDEVYLGYRALIGSQID